MLRDIQTNLNKQILNNVCSYRNHIFEKIERNHPDSLWLGSGLHDIKKIVLIASSSRSGSSLMFDILKKLPGVYSPSGESVPFYKLNGLASDLYDSDEINAAAYENITQINKFSRDLMSDFAFSTSPRDFRNEDRCFENYIHDLLLRFSMEWPLIYFEYEKFSNIARKALAINFNSYKQFILLDFYLDLLYLLKKEYPDLNPFYYDIPLVKLALRFPNQKEFSGPPNNTLVIEEPPFILVSPRRNVNKSDLNDKILLLKDPVSSYRLQWLEKTFPNAEIKIIYLSRNPASSINGLFDGWLHRGFFSGNLKYLLRSKNIGARKLNIKGYSDKVHWGKWWWNFDRPPNWEHYIDLKLEEVCGFQWQANNDAILRFLHSTPKKIYRLKFEDIIRGPESRQAKFKEISKFIGYDGDIHNIIDIWNLPIIQATQTPRLARWTSRQEIIMPVIQTVKISEISEKIGYKLSHFEDWI